MQLLGYKTGKISAGKIRGRGWDGDFQEKCGISSFLQLALGPGEKLGWCWWILGLIVVDFGVNNG